MALCNLLHMGIKPQPPNTEPCICQKAEKTQKFEVPLGPSSPVKKASPIHTHAMMTRSKARAAAAANDMYDISSADVAAFARGTPSVWPELWTCPWCEKTAHPDDFYCIITQHNDDCPGADNCCGDCEGDDVCRECEITYYMAPI